MRNRNPFIFDEKRKLHVKQPMNPLVLVEGEPAPRCEASVKTYGNIWTRRLVLKKGQSKEGHKHEFDHLHHLIKGKVEIRVYKKDREDEPMLVREFDATNEDKWIKVPKEHFHDIVALEDAVGYCIQAVRNDNQEVVNSDYAYDKDWMEEVSLFEKEKGLADETTK